jgi:hypothetical protein
MAQVFQAGPGNHLVECCLRAASTTRPLTVISLYERVLEQGINANGPAVSTSTSACRAKDNAGVATATGSMGNGLTADVARETLGFCGTVYTPPLGLQVVRQARVAHATLERRSLVRNLGLRHLLRSHLVATAMITMHEMVMAAMLMGWSNMDGIVSGA